MRVFLSFCLQCKASLPERLPSQIGRKRLYCSQVCFRIYRGYQGRVSKPTHCWYCHAELDQNKAGTPRRYCSRKHASLYRVANKPKKPKILRHCEYCFQPFESALPQQIFCSHDCRKKGLSVRAMKWREENPKPDVYKYVCDKCQAVVERKYRVTKGKFGRYCDKCRLKLRRARDRVKTVRRQSLTVKPSRLSCDEVAERDGFVCHICKGLVDMSLPRVGGFGATVDHVIPLSKGGSDYAENLRLAHWICNIKKGDKVDA